MVKDARPTAAPENWETQIRKGWLELAILASLWGERLYGLDFVDSKRTPTFSWPKGRFTRFSVA